MSLSFLITRGRCLSDTCRACVLFTVALALSLSLHNPAKADALKTCTEAYAEWIALRDSSLRRLDANPTLWGHDTAWCAPSPQHVSELRKKLFALDKRCEKVPATQKASIVDLMIQSLQMLKRVRPCAAGVAALPTTATVTSRNTPAPSVTPPPTVTATQNVIIPQNVTASPTATPPTPNAVAAPQGSPAPPPSRREERIAQAQPAVPAPPKKQLTATAPTQIKEDTAKSTARVALVKPAAALPLASLDAPSMAPEAQPAISTPTSHRFSPADENCLTIELGRDQQYVVDASRCTSRVTLAAIDVYPSNDAPRCITTRISSRPETIGPSARPPEINFQCIALAGGCTPDALRRMFPECAAQ